MSSHLPLEVCVTYFVTWIATTVAIIVYWEVILTQRPFSTLAWAFNAVVEE